MQYRRLLFTCMLFCSLPAFAQSCEGGLYLNPQVIRGEGASQTESALHELVDFLRPTGLSVAAVVNVKEAGEVLTAVKKPAPPCWIYGNPVVGLASGYKPVAVNMNPIQAAVVILGDIGKVKDSPAVELKTLAPTEQARVLTKLKSTSCFGMKSGVTTVMVKAQNLCGTINEVTPQQGLGQSYLPTKAAFYWQADRWAGLITRLQTAQQSTMKGHFGTDERIHFAQLVVVPVANSSWGYGLYAHPSAPAEAVKKASAQFGALRKANPLLLKALDLGAAFEFAAPPEAAVQAMKKSLQIAP